MRTPLVGVVVAFLLIWGGLPAAADALASKVSSARGQSLPVDGSIDSAAQASAQRQADAGGLSHASLSGLGCSSAGEVVGMGPDIDAIWNGFRNSSSHWSLITKSAWTSMGTGIATASDGAVYVSIIFCAQAGAAPSPGSPATDPNAEPPSDSDDRAPVGRSSDKSKPETPTYQVFIQRWLDEMEILAVTAFGAMPPPIAAEDDLLAMMPVVI